MIQRRTKWWLFSGAILTTLLLFAFAIQTWVVPALIVAAIRAHYQGKVAIRGWWWDGETAGVVGLSLFEGTGTSKDSTAWATVEHVSTELSLGRLIRGQITPRRVAIGSPRVTLRLDSNGRPLTRIPIAAEKHASGSAPSLPELVVEKVQVTIRQVGRPEMDLSGVSARLIPGPAGTMRLSADLDQPAWGQWNARGEFRAGFKQGEIQLTGRGLVATPEKEACIPFVPAEVWKNVLARGPLGVRLDLRIDAGKAQPISVRTEIDLRKATVTLPVFGVDASGTTGAVVIEDGLVTMKDVAGRALGGDVETGGTLDFTQRPPRVDLSLKLDGVEVANAPPAWQLERMQVSGGLMSGTARVRAALAPDRVDLTGTTGDAEVRGATLQGFPVKSLRLHMRAQGTDLHYETETDSPLVGAKPGVDPIAQESPRETTPAQESAPKRAGPALRLPHTFTTDIDLEDVELSTLVARAALLRIKLPSDIAGRFSLKARATIPLGNLRDARGYVIHGKTSLSRASIVGVDLSHATAKFDLEGGVLELTDFQGQFVNLPDGDGARRPEAVEPVGPDEPLPEGGFRGGLHAELSPPGRLSAHFSGHRLPLGEMTAPVLPRPTPVSGLVSVDATADAAVDALTDPRAWKASGHLQGMHIAHGTATLESVLARFTLDGGKLAIPEITAKLDGRPLDARLNAELFAPYGYDGAINVGDWSLDTLLALIPTAPHPAPVGGEFTIRADARGTLVPWTVETKGAGRLSGLRTGPMMVGDVPFRWTTGPDEIVFDRIVAPLFGGQFVVHGHVPRGAGGSAELTINLIGIDAARVTAALPQWNLKMAGKAEIRVTAAAATEPKADAPAVLAEGSLSSRDLMIQGAPVREGHGSLAIRNGVLDYEVRTDALATKVQLKGSVHLAKTLGGGATSETQVQAGWFSLEDLLKAQGMTGAIAQFHGMGAVAARVDVPEEPAGRRARAIGEVRGLRWTNIPIGNLKADAVMTPTHWHVKRLSGDLIGSPIHGEFWGNAADPVSPRLGGNLKIERISLAKLGAFLPGTFREEDLLGYASLNLEGRQERASAEIRIDQARILGIPLAELHIPAEVGYVASTGLGTLQIRPSTVQLAGGFVRGEGLVHFGTLRGGHGDFSLNSVDLGAFERINTDVRRPVRGRVSGRIRIEQVDPTQLVWTRGKMHLDLTDASLLEVPVLRQIDQFLGSEFGGIFEAGELDASLGGGKLTIDRLALAGRLIQLRAKGTIGLQGALELKVLVKRNHVLPQAGRAVASSILGNGRSSRENDAKVLGTSKRLADGPIKLRIAGTITDTIIIADPSMSFVE